MTTRTAKIAPEHEGVIASDELGRGTVRFERRLVHPVERVWAALVEPAGMEAWLAYRARIEPEVGGSISLWLGTSDSKEPISWGTVTAFDPPRRFETQWQDGSTHVWLLAPDEAGCRLTFTVTTADDVDRVPNSEVAGWHLRMELLSPALDGLPADWAALDATKDEHGFVERIVEIYWHYRNQARPG